LKKKKVAVLEEAWPAVSCDMNPVEQVWQWLDFKVKRRGPYGVQELEKFVREEFAAIPQLSIDKLVLSFEERCQKIKKSRGNVIKP